MAPQLEGLEGGEAAVPFGMPFQPRHSSRKEVTG